MSELPEVRVILEGCGTRQDLGNAEHGLVELLKISHRAMVRAMEPDELLAVIDITRKLSELQSSEAREKRHISARAHVLATIASLMLAGASLDALCKVVENREDGADATFLRALRIDPK